MKFQPLNKDKYIIIIIIIHIVLIKKLEYFSSLRLLDNLKNKFGIKEINKEFKYN